MWRKVAKGKDEPSAGRRLQQLVAAGDTGELTWRLLTGGIACLHRGEKAR